MELLERFPDFLIQRIVRSVKSNIFIKLVQLVKKEIRKNSGKIVKDKY